MKKCIISIGFIFFLTVLSWGKVGDILKVIKNPGPCSTGLAFDGKFL